MGGGHRQSSKGNNGGGGKVGGFLQLYDWNAKSRKKFFSNKSDNSDQSKQKKRSDGNLPTTRFNDMDIDEYVAVSSFKGSSEYSCASSVTDEEGYGSKAPSVVARLMGLDSMPPSNISEPFSTPFLDSQSLRESQYVRQKLEFRPSENQDIYSGNLRNKVDAPIRKAQKILNRPIEKFQSEILPPKSAKTIPITHHKLLSPIKSPGFNSLKNAAHIMEAAAKIIEPASQQTSTSKSKMPSIHSSSVPFKVRELREKVEASQRSSRRSAESNAAKVLQGQHMNKSWNGSPDPEEHVGANNKGKSVSLALQAKVNVQKREYRKEPGEVMLSQPFKSQTSNQKNISRKPANHSISSALKLNNQKQNCPVDKEKLNSKSSVSVSQSRSKSLSGDPSSGRGKNASKYGGNSKVGSRKLSPEANDSKQEVLYSSTRNVPRKRRSLDGNFNKDKDQNVDNMLVDIDEKTTQSNEGMDRHLTWAEENKKKGMDVVSFTFTTPLSRQNNIFGSEYGSKKAMLSSDCRNNGKLTSVDNNVIGSDDLSILLEQKLRELTQAEESSRYRDKFSGSSAPMFQDISLIPIAVASTTVMHKKKSQDTVYMDIMSGKGASNFTLTGGKGLLSKYKLQGTMEVEEGRSNDTEIRKSPCHRQPSPISVLDLSFMTGSWNSSDTIDSMNIEVSGTKHGSSVQAMEVLGMNPYGKPHSMEIDTELADSASSLSTKTLAKGKSRVISLTSNMGSKWEIQYVYQILFDVELMFKDFALGRVHEIINPHLFNQLENRKEILVESPYGSKVERKVLFDCVSECMDLRCSRYANVGFKGWAKGLATLRRKESLAEDVYKEISNWKGMEDSMVDDLVDKDMSSRCGKWTDFEVEAFELGIQIEGRILNFLINEIVTDLVIR